MTIWIAEHVLATMRTDGRLFHPLETGGILLGWRSGHDKIIAQVRGAGPNALHGRSRFLPDHRWQMREIEDAFRNSDGDLDYLGDWHTHPDGMADMSDEDERTLMRIARRVRQPIMLILANSSNWDWSYGCWLGQRKLAFLRQRGEIVRVDLQTFTT